METRTLKELLQLTLSQGNKTFKKRVPFLYPFGHLGLCGFVKCLLINEKELTILIDFIENNRPSPDSPHYCKTRQDSSFYWAPWLWAPRKKWLIDQIKSL